MDKDLTRDQLIGQNIASMRGELSQQALADAMRAQGFDWAQATVWSVEKGKRPVRLAEAEAVARILRVTVEDLLRVPAMARIIDLDNRLTGVEIRLDEAAREWERLLAQLVTLADEQGVSEGEVEEITQFARMGLGVDRFGLTAAGYLGALPAVARSIKEVGPLTKRFNAGGDRRG
ncbi:helix-turn-helix transcriptional regulator [Microbacterium sp.]|uniref:helix-turn-helix transcriptional regulator n=1 Tax=Microbacterium sp. TaxID=51671 RepID=UPI0037C6F22A